MRWHQEQQEPTGPVPVVNRFDNYMRNHDNTDIATSCQTLSHRRGAGGGSVLAAAAV